MIRLPPLIDFDHTKDLPTNSRNEKLLQLVRAQSVKSIRFFFGVSWRFSVKLVSTGVLTIHAVDSQTIDPPPLDRAD